MGTMVREIKRPNEATPQRALALFGAGVKPAEMAKMWGISKPYIYYLLKKAGWTREMPR